MPYVLVLHNRKKPSPTSVTSFMNSHCKLKLWSHQAQLLERFIVHLVDVVPDSGVAGAVEKEDSAAQHAVDGGEGPVQSHILKVKENIQW